MGVGTALLIGSQLAYSYWQSRQAKNRADDVKTYTQKRVDDAKQTTKYEKAALATLRSQLDDPTGGKQVMADASRTIADKSQIAKQEYLGKATTFMDKSFVAKKVTEKIDLGANKQLVDLAEKIAIQNQAARTKLAGSIAQTELKIGQAKEARIEAAEGRDFTAGQNVEIAKQAVYDSSFNAVKQLVGMGLNHMDQEAIAEAQQSYLSAGPGVDGDQARMNALMVMSKHGKTDEWFTMLESLTPGATTGRP